MLHQITEEEWNIVRNQSYDIEFDWVGIDNGGNLGVFSSFNRGLIPEKAISSFEKYQALAVLLNDLHPITNAILFTKESGNFKEWLDFSRKGFFTFDYQDIHWDDKLGRYDLIAIPMIPLKLKDVEIIESFMDIVPTFNLSFEANLPFTKLENNYF